MPLLVTAPTEISIHGASSAAPNTNGNIIAQSVPRRQPLGQQRFRAPWNSPKKRRPHRVRLIAEASRADLEETNAVHRAMWADKQFKLRMLAARNGGRERFVLGIERQAEG